MRLEVNVTEISKMSKMEDASKKLLGLNDLAIYVGIPEEKSSRGGTGITNAELGFIQSNGVFKSGYESTQQYIKGMPPSMKAQLLEQGSPLYRIPPRPFIQPALNAHKEEIISSLERTARMALSSGSTSVISSLNKLGLRCQNWVRRWFTDPANGWAPNAPSTIKKKGSSRPLIDTGELRKSISYVIRRGGKNI